VVSAAPLRSDLEKTIDDFARRVESGAEAFDEE